MEAPGLKKFSVAGKQIFALTRQDRINVDDVYGNLLSLVESDGFNVSTGKTEFRNKAHVVTYSISDLVNYNVPFEGCSKLTKMGYFIFVKYKGKIFSVLSADGTPAVTLETTYSPERGTGEFGKIIGCGNVQGTYLTSLVYAVDWEGGSRIKK